jgi:hypothetical protein
LNLPKSDSKPKIAIGQSTPATHFSHQSIMLVGTRVRPVAVIAGLIIMVIALVYIALNRAHSAPPQTPLHQSR